MAQFLVDTHVVIYFLSDPEKLGVQVREVLQNPQNEIYISILCWWEIAIKMNIGKLSIAFSLEEAVDVVNELGFISINLSYSDVLNYVNLPLYHRDPFDRMLIIQAQNRNLALISQDVAFDNYSTERFW